VHAAAPPRRDGLPLHLCRVGHRRDWTSSARGFHQVWPLWGRVLGISAWVMRLIG
jgi:hypothetical protein